MLMILTLSHLSVGITVEVSASWQQTNRGKRTVR